VSPRPDRPPEGLGFLFVVTYGRSGSTLLMGLLNSIPGYLLRGENWDALHHLFLFHRTLAEGSRRWDPARLRQRTHPFFGAGDFPERRSLERTRELVLDTVLRPREDTRVTGFKEIRWYRDDVEEYVAWLREVFPGARFVVNTRDLEHVGRSGWWAKSPENAAALPRVEARILELAAGLGDAAYRVHYDDYVADPTVLRGLFDWLGEPYDEARVREVLATRHSVGGRGEG
jgi:sulfotransferase family protein